MKTFGIGGCARPCGARRKSDVVPAFSEECPLTKNLIWRRAVSTEEEAFNLANPVKPVLGGQVCADGQFGKELTTLFEVRRTRSWPSMGNIDEGSPTMSWQENSWNEVSVAPVSNEVDPSPATTAMPAGVNQDFDDDLEELGFEVSEGQTALLEVLKASGEQRLLVKTVKNDGWNDLLSLLTGPAFKTSTTLLPANGLGMRLFSEPYRAVCGLIWDTKEMDLSSTYMWPSGYFAKTEFNLNTDGTLAAGRAEALVTLDQLRAANNAKEFKDFLTGKINTGCVMPYNEVLAAIEGKKVVGVFSRSTQIKHLLMAMGIRDRLADLMPELGVLPLLLHDPENGLRPFTETAQWLLVHRSLKMELAVKLPFPLDLRVVASGPDGGTMNPVDQLRFHAKYGITEEALHEVVDFVQGADTCAAQSPCAPEIAAKRRFAECAAFTLLALDMAVDADNANSALSIVRNVAPLVFPVETAPDQVPFAPTASVGETSDMIEGIAEPSVTLTSLLARSKSSGVRVAVGACLALESYANGRSRQKVKNAITLLQEWLAHADTMSFRLKSLMDEKKERCHRMPSASEVGTFVSERIISNRTFFLKTLQEIDECKDRLTFFEHLRDLSLKLAHPCLRLHMLQGFMGLDTSYDRDTVVEVLKLAYDLVSTMDGKTA